MEVTNRLVRSQFLVSPLVQEGTCGPTYGDEGIEADICEEIRELCSHTNAL